jgi:hypothetical protein
MLFSAGLREQIPVADLLPAIHNQYKEQVKTNIRLRR